MWNAFESKEFLFMERKATIVYPKTEPNGKMILKTEYLDAFPKLDIAMLERGYYLIHITHFSRWAPDEETAIMAEFVKHCAKELGITDGKCILEGMSAGGMQAVRLAELYPELCAVMYLDAPALNLLSLAGHGELKQEKVDVFWREIASTFNVTRTSIINFRKSPIDNMEPLIENNIPVIMLYGNADDDVIYEENGKVLEDFYKANNGNMKTIVRSMGKHHPHGLDDPTPIIDFIEKNYK